MPNSTERAILSFEIDQEHAYSESNMQVALQVCVVQQLKGYATRKKYLLTETFQEAGDTYFVAVTNPVDRQAMKATLLQALAELKEKLQQQTVNCKILLPIQVQTNHWAIGEIQIKKKEQQYTIILACHDATLKTNEIYDQLYEEDELRNFKEGIHQFIISFDATANTQFVLDHPYNKKRLESDDAVSTGAVVIEELVLRAKGHTLILPNAATYSPGAGGLRSKQLLNVYDAFVLKESQALLEFLTQSGGLVSSPSASPKVTPTNPRPSTSTSPPKALQPTTQTQVIRGRDLSKEAAAFWAARYDHAELLELLLGQEGRLERKHQQQVRKLAILLEKQDALQDEGQFINRYYQLVNAFNNKRGIEINFNEGKKSVAELKRKWAHNNANNQKLLIVFDKDKQTWCSCDRYASNEVEVYAIPTNTALHQTLQTISSAADATKSKKKTLVKLINQHLVEQLSGKTSPSLKDAVAGCYEEVKAFCVQNKKEVLEKREALFDPVTGEVVTAKSPAGKAYITRCLADYPQTLEAKFQLAFASQKDVESTRMSLKKRFDKSEQALEHLMMTEIVSAQQNIKVLDKQIGREQQANFNRLLALLSAADAPILYKGKLEDSCQQLLETPLAIDVTNIAERNLLQEAIEHGSVRAAMVILKRVGLFLGPEARQTFCFDVAPGEPHILIPNLVQDPTTQLIVEVIEAKTSQANALIEKRKQQSQVGVNYLLVKNCDTDEWLFYGGSQTGKVFATSLDKIPSFARLIAFLDKHTVVEINQKRELREQILQAIQAQLGQPPALRYSPFVLVDADGNTFLHQLIQQGFFAEAWEWIERGASSHTKTLNNEKVRAINATTPAGETLLAFFLKQLVSQLQQLLSLQDKEDESSAKDCLHLEQSIQQLIQRVWILINRGANPTAGKYGSRAVDVLKTLPEHELCESLVSLLYVAAAMSQVEEEQYLEEKKQSSGGKEDYQTELSQFHKDIVKWSETSEIKMTKKVSGKQLKSFVGKTASIALPLRHYKLTEVTVDSDTALKKQIRKWEQKNSQKHFLLVGPIPFGQSKPKWYFCGKDVAGDDQKGFLEALKFTKLQEALDRQAKSPELLKIVLKCLGYVRVEEALLSEMLGQLEQLGQAFAKLNAKAAMAGIQRKNLEAMFRYMPEEYLELIRFNFKAVTQYKDYAQYPREGLIEQAEKERREKEEERQEKEKERHEKEKYKAENEDLKARLAKLEAKQSHESKLASHQTSDASTSYNPRFVGGNTATDNPEGEQTSDEEPSVTQSLT